MGTSPEVVLLCWKLLKLLLPGLNMLENSFLGRRWICRRHDLFVTIFSLSAGHLAGCGTYENGESAFQELYENGVLWSYGEVELGALEAPGAVMLETLTPGLGIDDSRARFNLFPAVYGQGNSYRKNALAYVDLTSDGKGLHAYAYDLLFESRAGARSTIDIYARLKKEDGGFSYEKRRKVYLGSATFDRHRSVKEVRLAPDLKLSRISKGPFKSRWALHYPSVAIRNYHESCRGIFSLPGHQSNQIVQQTGGVCRPLPSQEDICAGTPLAAGCRPEAPARPATATTGHDAHAPEATRLDENVFRLVGDNDSTHVVFIARSVKSTATDNAAQCANAFYALGRTATNKVNESCKLKLAASSEPTDGMLTCRVHLQFIDAQTYSSKVCNITGTFRVSDGTLESETIQILKP